MNTRKIIVKEVAPEDTDFSNYFDDEGLTSASGILNAVYIPAAHNSKGFSSEEYSEYQEKANSIIEYFEEVSNKEGYYSSYKEIMLDYDISYSSKKCNLLKQWAKNADTDNSECMAEFLTIIHNTKWLVKSFHGYSQGDFCEVVYCEKSYSDETVKEIGNFYLGCGFEFCIDDCYGYYVLDTIRWNEGETLKQALAELSGYNVEQLEIHLYIGSYKVNDYKLLA